ncbi:molybdopterin-dependent oxidoreductase [Humibacter albus]|uniref:molybdopterin-dependent oxidoreductase n=1 Tax=Humibacter albus TaxID=427754 RepID=UPI00041C9BCD|nr:molybdopterin-dependent oxidoreductase [Humibacter albus]
MSDSGKTTRRGLLIGIGATAATLIALTAGQSFGVLSSLNLFAPRRHGGGPQGLPVTRTAEQAKVAPTALDPSWRLRVIDGPSAHEYSREQLLGLEQTDAELPIACVEGWSTDASWCGVRLHDLLTAVRAPADAAVRLTSLEPKGHYRTTTMGPEFAHDPRTLVALEVNGEPLDLDHGYPARIIAPGRPGVLQTKWLSTIEVIR